MTDQPAIYAAPNATILPPADAYIFDIDGTLLVTKDLVHWNALHQAMLEAYGVDTTIKGVPYHGMTDLSILRAALGRVGIDDEAFEARLPKALEMVCREVELNRKEIAPLVCSGIRELLRSLSQDGKLLGVASGNLENVGWHKIEAAGLREYFSFGCFSDHCEHRAGIFQNALNHVARRLGVNARACFIGDTPSDVKAAREIGAPIVAVASGTFSLDELTACSPDLCVSSCSEFLGNHYFLRSSRLGFRTWREDDLPLAIGLWGDPEVTRFIDARTLTSKQVREILGRHIAWQCEHGIEYWPIFLLKGREHVGCCGLRPYDAEKKIYEFGVHIRSKFWRQGFAHEAAEAVIEHAFRDLGARALFAGHNPNNHASRALLRKLGFQHIKDELYAPTGLMHPAYLLTR